MGRDSNGEEEIQVVDLVFDVVRIDLPLTNVQESRKIWNHVDELRVSSDVAARLARNGVRIGAAETEAWTPIRTIVEATGGEVRRDRLIPHFGAALAIKLAAVENDESIFVYERSGRLVGKTFSTGDKLLNVDYAFHPELGGFSDLRLQFEIRSDRGVMTWERRGGVIREVPAYDRHVFSDLNVLLTLNRGEFLVLGWGGRACNEYLIGSRFLTFRRSGKRYETLLCITPEPFRTQGTKLGSSYKPR